jgi:tetratricopeptide (TPR) repeat protein
MVIGLFAGMLSAEGRMLYAPTDSLFLAAVRYKLQDRPDSAFAVLQKVLQIDSTSSSAWYETALYYLNKQNTAQALPAMQKAVAATPGNVVYRRLLADLYRQTGHEPEAIALYEELIRQDPQEVELYYYLSNLYLQQNQAEKAIEALNRLENDMGVNEAVSIQKFRLYRTLNQPKKALREIEILRTKFPTDARFAVLMGDYYLEENRPDSAQFYFETALKMDAEDPELNRRYGLFLLSQGQTEAAKAQFRLVAQALPDDISSWTQLLEIVLRDEDPDEIIAICQRALTHFPEVPLLYFYKGTACYQKSDYTKAVEIYRKGIAVTPEKNLGLLSTFTGQIADIDYRLGKTKEAFEGYETALRYNDKNVTALNNYAYHLALANEQLDKAERMAATAVNLQSTPTNLDTYAWVLFRKGSYSLAKFYIESALAKESDPSSELLEHYGDILYQAGLPERALAEWQRALPLKEAEQGNTKLLKKKIKDRRYYEK